MKKDLIIVMPNMEIGGAERALINLLYQLPQDKFNIELLLLSKKVEPERTDGLDKLITLLT